MVSTADLAVELVGDGVNTTFAEHDFAVFAGNSRPIT